MQPAYEAVEYRDGLAVYTLPVAEGECRCGCGQRTRIATKTRRELGWVRGRPRPLLPGHRFRGPFIWRISKEGHHTPCWVWAGSTNAEGYGTVQLGGLARYMHRWSYEHFVGPIGAGLVIDHLCRNPSCSNPEHLEVVTRRENCYRGKHVVLTDADVEFIRTAEHSMAEMAARFGVSREHVGMIRNGKRRTAA